MKPIRNIFLFLATLVALIGCQREFPEPEQNEPVFWVEAEIGNELLNIQAGVNDYYLEADYRKDSLDVVEFVGNFKTVNCTDCRESLTIVIRDKEISPVVGPVDPAQRFLVESLPYRGQSIETDSMSFSFRVQSSGTPPFTYQWDFGDGHTSTESEPKHTFGDSELYEVSAQVQDANGCIDVSRHQVRAGKFFHHCQVGFSHRLDGDRAFSFKAEPIDFATSYNEVYWSFGDGSVAYEYTPSHQYQHEGIYEVKMVLIQPDGSVCCDIKNIFSDEGASCVSFIQFEPIPSDPHTGTVYIEWIDKNGVKYSTDAGRGQGPDHRFQILEVGPEWTDIDAQKAMQLTADFSCRLYNVSNPEEYLDLEMGSVNFAVAFP